MKTTDEIINVAKKICKQQNFLLDEKSEDGGSFKKVYKVTSKSNQTFALKIIKSTTRSPRIVREISAIQKCDHPNISKIFRFDTINYESKEYDYFIEEYLGGGNLSKLLGANGRLQRRDAIFIGNRLVSSLEHLHSKSLVHRDIKPDNIMFRENTLEPVLVDFSVVRDLADVSLTQSWLDRGPGTPLFSAPEQINNQKKYIDWRTDQFALGVVMSIVILNFHPYQESDEVYICNETVENITNRKRNKKFMQKCEESDCLCLDKMTKPWPVERYRFPHELSNYWKNQEVNNV